MFGGFSFFSPLPDQVYALKVAGQILRSKSLYSHQVTLVFVTVSAHSFFFFCGEFARLDDRSHTMTDPIDRLSSTQFIAHKAVYWVIYSEVLIFVTQWS
jgi:hypothetical protein